MHVITSKHKGPFKSEKCIADTEREFKTRMTCEEEKSLEVLLSKGIPQVLQVSGFVQKMRSKLKVHFT